MTITAYNNNDLNYSNSNKDSHGVARVFGKPQVLRTPDGSKKAVISMSPMGKFSHRKAVSSAQLTQILGTESWDWWPGRGSPSSHSQGR